MYIDVHEWTNYHFRKNSWYVPRNFLIEIVYKPKKASRKSGDNVTRVFWRKDKEKKNLNGQWTFRRL